MSNTKHPAEALQISPEALDIANNYLQFQDIHKTSDELGIPVQMVTDMLSRREVKAYIDTVFINYGYNNQFKLRKVMDAVIEKKLQDLEESEMGSQKDITEILALSHKMTMDVLDRQIKLATLEQSNIKNQVNVQVNEAGGSNSNYVNLIENLLKENNDNK